MSRDVCITSYSLWDLCDIEPELVPSHKALILLETTRGTEFILTKCSVCSKIAGIRTIALFKQAKFGVL